MIEDLINQAQNIHCFDTTNINLFREKTRMLSRILCEIEDLMSKDVERARKMLKLTENIILNYGYEAAYSRTIANEATKYVHQLLPKLVELGEKVFEGKELVPFLREKLYYTWDEPARRNLYNRIDELEK